jgi:hypothetical protein
MSIRLQGPNGCHGRRYVILLEIVSDYAEIDIGENASVEGGDDNGVEDRSQTVNVVNSFRLQSISFNKKAYLRVCCFYIYIIAWSWCITVV